MACKWIDSCPLRRFEEQGKLDDKWKKQYCERDFTKCKRYQMAEKGIYHSDNILPDGTINKKLKS